jgi:hypothetical protein
MRVRLTPVIEQAIHREALRQGRSDQDTAQRAILAGLANTGTIIATVNDEDPQPARRANDYRITMPIPSSTYLTIKALARDQGRSTKAMIRQILESGIAEVSAPADERTHA